MEDDNYCDWEFLKYAYGLGYGITAFTWSTGCGHEIDLPIGSQPRKYLCWNYCPFCGREIRDLTVDC